MKKPLLSICICVFAISIYAQPESVASKAEKSIEQAANYFRNLGDNISRPVTVMLLQTMQAHFKYDFRLLPLSQYKEKNGELNKTYFRLYNTYYNKQSSHAYNDSLAGVLKSTLSEGKTLNFYSLFCKTYPLPENYQQALEEMAQIGGFDAVLSASFVENSLQCGCYKSKTGMEQLKTRLIETLKVQANPSMKSPDLDKYGAIAMLYYLGEEASVTDEHIKEIIKNQMSNGAWSQDKDIDEEPHELTSVVALLALMEYRSRHHH